jgi:hypothetical protein
MTSANNNTAKDNAANNNTASANKPTSVAAILAAGKKDVAGGSAYGLTVQFLCADLGLLNDRAGLLAKLDKAGINTKTSKNAVQTGISQTAKIVSYLVDNGYLK